MKIRRLFSTVSRNRKYAHLKHLETVGQGKRLEEFNKIEEGMSADNTDYTKPYGKKKTEALKPI